jgi:multisubunit Na+/H+ antiporter MnhB subunit
MGFSSEKMLGIYMLVILGITLLGVVVLAPDMGTFSQKEAASYYLESGLQDTGSANIVNSIVWDYRGYDTLGEETVLFTAALGIFLMIRKKT